VLRSDVESAAAPPAEAPVWHEFIPERAGVRIDDIDVFEACLSVCLSLFGC
jgi:hypothetical protein